MRKIARTKVDGSLALAAEHRVEAFSQAAKDAYIASAKVLNGVMYNALPVGILKIDTYQRPVQKKARDIAANWDSFKVDPLDVSYRDGEFWVVDGQNRMEAAKIVGIEFLYCKITTNRTRQQEALDFVHQNDGVTTISSFDIFNALLIAGDRSAISIKRMCDLYNVRYYKDKKATTPEFGGMSAILDACDKHGESGVEWILDTIQKLGWHNDRKAYCNAVIRALSNLYGSYENKRKTKIVLVSNLDGRRHSPQETIVKAMYEHPSRGATRALTMFMDGLVTFPNRK